MENILFNSFDGNTCKPSVWQLLFTIKFTSNNTAIMGISDEDEESTKKILTDCFRSLPHDISFIGNFTGNSLEMNMDITLNDKKIYTKHEKLIKTIQEAKKCNIIQEKKIETKKCNTNCNIM